MQKSRSVPGSKSSRLPISPRTLSPIRSRQPPQDQDMTIQQSYQSLSYTTSQLQLISQALETITKEKSALTNITSQLKKQIAKTTSDCQGLKKNHERLHNETIKINRATERLEAERVLMEKECEMMEGDSREDEGCAGRLRYEVTKMQTLMGQEAAAVSNLQVMTSKMKKELSLQLRERDALRTESATLSKQTDQLRERITKLHSTNQKFMKQIKSTAQELGAALNS